MRHRTEKYKEKPTRKNPNKEKIVDVRANVLDPQTVRQNQLKVLMNAK